MNYYDSATGKAISRPTRINNVTNPSDATLAKHGIYPYTPFSLPEGQVVVAGTHRFEVIDGEHVELWDTETVEEQAARVAQSDQDRIQNLAMDYGNDVIILGVQLAKFTDPETAQPYTMPVDPKKVIADIKQGLLSGRIPQTMIGESKTLEAIYKDLSKVMSDDDIATIAR